MLKLLVLALFLLPFIEITGIVLAVREFGFMNSFFFWLSATILGAGIVRTSGLRLTVGVAKAVQEGKPPAAAAIDTALVGVAGILLLIPGYVSDALAIVLLISPLRRFWARRMAKSVSTRMGFSARASASSAHSDGTTAEPTMDASHAVIDVDAVVIDDVAGPEKS